MDRIMVAISPLTYAQSNAAYNGNEMTLKKANIKKEDMNKMRSCIMLILLFN